MRKKLLLLGAMTILSTTVLGYTPTIKEVSDRVSSNQNVLVKQAQGSYQKTNSMIESSKKLGIEVTRDEPTGTTDAAKFGNGFKVNDKAQAEVFDKAVDVIVENRENLKGKADQKWVTAEITAGLELNNMIRDMDRELEKKEIKEEINTVSDVALTNKTTLEEHKKELARLDDVDKQLIEKDKKLQAVDEDLKTKDKHLEKVDATLASNMNDIIKHNNAIYEDVTSYAEGAQPVVKADINRARIEALESTRATESEQIVNNTAKIEEHEEKISINQSQISQAQELIDHNSYYIEQNSNRIDKLESRVDNLQSEMNKGFAMSAAMSSVDFQVLEVGDAGLGVGVGNYQNAQAISLGMGLRPTERTTFNVKGAMSTGKKQETMVGAGAVYKFNLFN